MSSPRPRSALLGGFFLAMLALSSAHAAGVRQFSPQGEVDQPIRATAVFSANMVPLGRSDGPSPFAVDCGEYLGADGRTVIDRKGIALADCVASRDCASLVYEPVLRHEGAHLIADKAL